MARSAFMGTFREEANRWFRLLTEPQYDYIVAIARKCPRLIDVILREENTFSSSVWDKVITEHALPFHFAQMPKKHNYLLIDDSVFYGSTFKKIEMLMRNLNISQRENVYDYNEINIKNATLFLLKDNKRDDLNINIHFKDGNEQDAVTFVNYEMSAFLRGGPYDLEFPVIYYSGTFNENIINTALTDNFPEAQIYSLEEPVLLDNKENAFRKSWTILFYPINKRNAQTTDPEFSKIRIFLNETRNELRIVPFSPYPLTKDILEKFDLFLPDQYKDLYRDVYETVSQLLDTEANNDDERYIIYQTERSLVVWINYLLSMNLLIKNKKHLDNFLTSINASNQLLEKKDIRFLIGNKLADKLYDQIKTWFESTDTMTPLFIDYAPVYINGLEEMYIPDNYLTTFSRALSEKFKDSTAINEFVSWHFFCQHEFIDNASRNQQISNNYKRLRYGITYRGLYNSILVHKTDIDFEKDLHKIMDIQIDEGSVVPKYIKLSSPKHKAMWTRMFRSGERVPKFIEMINLTLTLIDLLKQNLNVSSIPKTILETYLLQALTNPMGYKELYCLSDYPFTRQIKHVKDGLPMYCAAMSLDKRPYHDISITQWLIEHKYLHESYDSFDLSVCTTEHKFYPSNTEEIYNELSSVFAGMVDTYYEISNFIFKLSLFGLSEKETKDIQIELLKLWKNKFDICNTETDDTSNSHSNTEYYKYIYEYIKFYRDFDDGLLTKIQKISESIENKDIKYWTTILHKIKEGKAFVFDTELDSKFQLAILLCAVYSTMKSQTPMLKNNDIIIQVQFEDNNIKRLYDFVSKKESVRSDILQQICKNVSDKIFQFY